MKIAIKSILPDKTAANLFPDGLWNILAVCTTARGTLICYKQKIDEVSVLFLDNNLNEIDRYKLPAMTSTVQSAEFHSVEGNKSTFLLNLDICFEKNYPFQNNKMLYGVLELRPYWYKIEILEGGILQIFFLDFWEHMYLTNIQSLHCDDKIYWFAIRSCPVIPLNNADDDVNDLLPRLDLVYAITAGEALPEFAVLGTDFELERFVQYKIVPSENNKLILVFNVMHSAMYLCEFDIKNKILKSKNITPRGQKNGEKSQLNLFEISKGNFVLFWLYSNRKVKRNKRDRGIWMASFSDFIENKINVTRLSEDKEVYFIHFFERNTNDIKEQLYYVFENGFSAKNNMVMFAEYKFDVNQGAIKGVISGNNELTKMFLRSKDGGFFLLDLNGSMYQIKI